MIFFIYFALVSIQIRSIFVVCRKKSSKKEYKESKNNPEYDEIPTYDPYYTVENLSSYNVDYQADKDGKLKENHNIVDNNLKKNYDNGLYYQDLSGMTNTYGLNENQWQEKIQKENDEIVAKYWNGNIPENNPYKSGLNNKDKPKNCCEWVRKNYVQISQNNVDNKNMNEIENKNQNQDLGEKLEPQNYNNKDLKKDENKKDQNTSKRKSKSNDSSEKNLKKSYSSAKKKSSCTGIYSMKYVTTFSLLSLSIICVSM